MVIFMPPTLHCRCRYRSKDKMQEAAGALAAVYCSPTDQRSNFSDPRCQISCAPVTTPAQLVNPAAAAADHVGYHPRRPDCAGNGNDVISSRGSPSSSSLSSPSMDDVNVPRSSMSYTNCSTTELDAPADDVTSGHNR